MKNYEITVKNDNGYSCGCCQHISRNTVEYNANNLTDLLKQFEEYYKKKYRFYKEDGCEFWLDEIIHLSKDGSTKTDISYHTKDYDKIIKEFEKKMKSIADNELKFKEIDEKIKKIESNIKHIKYKISINFLEKELATENQKLKRMKNERTKI
jgi:chromosome segregation ATPase